MNQLFVEIWMSVVGLIVPLGATAQIFRIWKRKSSEDISLLFYGMLTFCQVNWLWYGFYINSLCIKVTNGLGVLEVVVIFCLSLYYRQRR